MEEIVSSIIEVPAEEDNEQEPDSFEDISPREVDFENLSPPGVDIEHLSSSRHLDVETQDIGEKSKKLLSYLAHKFPQYLPITGVSQSDTVAGISHSESSGEQHSSTNTATGLSQSDFNDNMATTGGTQSSVNSGLGFLPNQHSFSGATSFPASKAVVELANFVVNLEINQIPMIVGETLLRLKELFFNLPKRLQEISYRKLLVKKKGILHGYMERITTQNTVVQPSHNNLLSFVLIRLGKLFNFDADIVLIHYRGLQDLMEVSRVAEEINFVLPNLSSAALRKFLGNESKKQEFIQVLVHIKLKN